MPSFFGKNLEKERKDDWWSGRKRKARAGDFGGISADDWFRMFIGPLSPGDIGLWREGGLIRKQGYAEGGTVLPPGGIVGGMDPEMMPPEDGELTRMSLEQIQLIPPEELQSIVIEAKQALEGMHPDPEAALEIFIHVFGEQELASLKEAVIREMEGGPPALPEEGDPSLMSDGLSDSIPASIDGMEPAALSEGEYVVPADAVSGLGNGDTNSGARRLEDMISKIRSVRGGMPQAPPAMDPMSVMPPGAGGYAMGGPVKSFRYAEGGLVNSAPTSNPSLSSSLFSLGAGSSPFLGEGPLPFFGAPASPVNVMDPYPGGSFETPAFVPPVDPVSNDYDYESVAEKTDREYLEWQDRINEINLAASQGRPYDPTRLPSRR